MLALLLMSSLAATTPRTVEITPQEISAKIKADGAKAVVDRLDHSGQWWAITNHIAHGSSKWIVLAPALSNGTDAGTSESLKISLAYALPKATAATLETLDPHATSLPISLQEACSSPFIEDSREHKRSYKRRTLATLHRIHEPELRAAAAACSNELRQVR